MATSNGYRYQGVWRLAEAQQIASDFTNAIQRDVYWPGLEYRDPSWPAGAREYVDQNGDLQVDTGDPYADNVSLLLNGNGTQGSTDIVDSSLNEHPITVVGNAQIDTTVKKYGTGSMYFDGNGDYLITPPSEKFSMKTEDFTLEFWYYPVSKTQSFPRMMQLGAASAWGTSNSLAFLDRHNDASTKFSVAIYNLGVNTLLLTSSTSVQNGQWYYLTLTRQGSTFQLFVNGILESTYNNAGSVSTSNEISMSVGGAPAADAVSNSYIDDLRITKGVARYTENFTPPTRELTIIKGRTYTSL